MTGEAMTAKINRLKKGGLEKRIQDHSDGRYFYGRLTEHARKVIREAYGNHQLNLEKIAEILTNKVKKELVRLLKKIGFYADKIVIS